MLLPLQPCAPTDFNFVFGDWRVRHRQLERRLQQCQSWREFDGLMSTRPILGGFGNLEDNLLHLPEGEVRAVALRSYDATAGSWSIWWLDGRFPGRVDVPVVGRFEAGVGTFFADDQLDGRPIRIRFIWQQIDPDHLRWQQAFSEDGGASWESNWVMDFTRSA